MQQQQRYPAPSGARKSFSLFDFTATVDSGTTKRPEINWICVSWTERWLAQFSGVVSDVGLKKIYVGGAQNARLSPPYGSLMGEGKLCPPPRGSAARVNTHEFSHSDQSLHCYATHVAVPTLNRSPLSACVACLESVVTRRSRGHKDLDVWSRLAPSAPLPTDRKDGPWLSACTATSRNHSESQSVVCVWARLFVRP